MDHGLDRPQTPNESVRTLPAEPCQTCAVAHQLAGQSTSGGAGCVAKVVDEDAVVVEDAVVMSGPQLGGLIVLPRRHVSGLEELPPPRRARVLAALRHATRLVRDANQGAASRVVVMTDPPASVGHVCFHVLPSCSPVRAPRWSDGFS